MTKSHFWTGLLSLVAGLGIGFGVNKTPAPVAAPPATATLAASPSFPITLAIDIQRYMQARITGPRTVNKWGGYDQVTSVTLPGGKAASICITCQNGYSLTAGTNYYSKQQGDRVGADGIQNNVNPANRHRMQINSATSGLVDTGECMPTAWLTLFHVACGGGAPVPVSGACAATGSPVTGGMLYGKGCAATPECSIEADGSGIGDCKAPA